MSKFIPNKKGTKGYVSATGLRVPAYVTQIVNNGPAFQLQLNLETAPRPTKSYTASICELREVNGGYALMFSEPNPTLSSQKNCLNVIISDISLVNIWENSREFISGVKTWVSHTYNGEGIKTVSIPSLEDSFAVHANMAFMGYQNGNMVFAFYNFDVRTAKAIAQNKIDKDVDWIDPIVQVFSTVRSAYPLLVQIEQIAQKIIEKYPRITGKEDQPNET